MGNIKKNILKTYRECKQLQDAALCAPFDEGVEIRKLSREKYKKYEFLKGLEKANERLNKKEKDNK